jgi:peptidoglycan DL-endopeptidase CwlO
LLSRLSVVRAVGSAAVAILTAGAALTGVDLNGLGLAGSAAAAPASDQGAAVTTCASVGDGSTGTSVRTIQKLIGTSVDGDFGPMTVQALETWQTSHHVTATGVVDAATWAAMPAATGQRACAQKVAGAGVTASCAALTTGTTGLAVDVLQKALTVTVSGTFTTATLKALKAAQVAAKLKVTGITARSTWKALKLTGTAVCPALSTAAAPDQAAQNRIRAKVVTLVAQLEKRPGLTTNPVAQQAIAFETKQIGKPYVWGGVGPKGYDCSGLQMTSYLHAGLTIPRTAAQQYAGAGTPEPLNKAKEGDLLFYASDVTKPSTVYHVAMYDGNGELLDSPHTGATVGRQALRTTDLLPVVIRPVASLVLPLRHGATGYSVTQLQRNLNRHGSQLPVDGTFGPTTVTAVKAWQTAHHLSASGVVHVPTWLSFS